MHGRQPGLLVDPGVPSMEAVKVGTANPEGASAPRSRSAAHLQASSAVLGFRGGSRGFRMCRSV